MASENTATLQPISFPENDCQSCRMHIAGGSGAAECLMETIRSQWTTPFGDSGYCAHPSARQFVNFVNSNPPISGDLLHEHR